MVLQVINSVKHQMVSLLNSGAKSTFDTLLTALQHKACKRQYINKQCGWVPRKQELVWSGQDAEVCHQARMAGRILPTSPLNLYSKQKNPKSMLLECKDPTGIFSNIENWFNSERASKSNIKRTSGRNCSSCETHHVLGCPALYKHLFPLCLRLRRSKFNCISQV